MTELKQENAQERRRGAESTVPNKRRVLKYITVSRVLGEAQSRQK